MSIILSILIVFASSNLFAQYEEYESYQSFSDLDKYQRDFGLIITPSLMYTGVDEANDVPGATVNDYSRNLFFYDIKMGYIFRGGFYFGLLYAGETQNIDFSNPQTSRESVGLSIGYYRFGFAISGTYFPYSKQTITGADDASEYSDGMGYQLDLAYYFRLGRYFSIGPQMVYKTINYKEAESATGTIDVDGNSKHTIFTPMISLLFNLYRG